MKGRRIRARGLGVKTEISMECVYELGLFEVGDLNGCVYESGLYEEMFLDHQGSTHRHLYIHLESARRRLPDPCSATQIEASWHCHQPYD